MDGHRKILAVGTLLALGIILPTPEIIGHTPRIPWMLYEHNLWLCYLRWFLGMFCFTFAISIILYYLIRRL